MELLNGILATVPVWLLWPTIVGIAVYWYLSKRYNYWKEAGIPYLPAIPLLGSTGRTILYPLHEVEMEQYKSMGRIYGMYVATRPALSVGDPDVLRDIFVRDFQFFTGRTVFLTNNPVMDSMVSNLQGEDWKRVRTLITPTFTTGKIKRMTSIFIDSAQTVKDNLKIAASQGKPVDVKRLFGAFTMDVIASSAFGTKIDSHNDPENPFVKTARNVFSRNMSWRLVLFMLYPGFMKRFRISPFAPGPMDFFTRVTLKIVEERKRSGQRRNDFLQMLMDAEQDLEKVESSKENDEAAEIGHEENNDQILKHLQGSKSMSIDELVAQCVIFFLAGYDTTASTLSLTAYELARNPDIQEKLIAEIDESIREKGELRYETIYDMKYLDNVVSETLRKYPPAVRGERLADEDYLIKNHNIKVTKGMQVRIPIYAIHHDPEHYPDPEKFNPERFSAEIKATRHPYTYLPFGAGPRNCVAMRFALMEVKVCIAYLLSQLRFRTCSETRIPPKYFFGQGILTPKDVMLKVEIRNDTS